MRRVILTQLQNPARDSVPLTPSLFSACFWLQSKVLMELLPAHLMPLDE